MAGDLSHYRAGIEHASYLYEQYDDPASEFLKIVVELQHGNLFSAVQLDEWIVGHRDAAIDRWAYEITKRIKAIAERDELTALRLEAEILDMVLRANGE